MKKVTKKAIIIILLISLLLSLCTVIINYLISNNGNDTQKNNTETSPTPTAIPEPISVTDLESTLYIFQKETKCLFTGEVDIDGKAVGKGHYTIYNDDGTTWSFYGVTHNKNVWDGRALNYPMKYGNDDVQYKCLYTGNLKNGIPNGEGTLRVEGTPDSDFTYSGNWKDGLYNGYGELVYDNPQKLNSIGNFEDGVYKPTFIQLADLLLDASMTALSDKDKAYLESAEANILQHDTEGLQVEDWFDFSKYISSQENEDNHWFKTRITVANTIEYPESMFGMPITEIIGYSNGGKYIFHGFYFGVSDKLVKDKSVKITGYPVGYGKYSSLSEIEAIGFIACEITD